MSQRERIEELEAEVDRLTSENLALRAKLEEAEIELQARRVYDAGLHRN